MQVILLEKVQGLGTLGDQVNVKPGYGRNFLVPQGKAVPATERNVAEFEARRAELEKASADALVAAQARAESLQEVSVTIKANAGDEGKLFGSVGVRDIVDALATAGHTVEKREVSLPEGPIRTSGEFSLVLHLHTDVAVSVTVIVEGE